VCQLRELIVSRRGGNLPLVVAANKADLGPQIHKEIFQVAFNYSRYCGARVKMMWLRKENNYAAPAPTPFP
jgi:hypothetical protein